MATASEAPLGFFARINASAAGQILSLAANSLQVVGFIISIIQGIQSSDQLLSALQKLEDTLANDFTALGNLIKQQIELTVTNEDTLAMTTALASSSTANDKMQRYLNAKDAADLDDADTQSDLGVQFFLGLPDPSISPAPLANNTDPFFLPGIVKAGTIRILVLALEDPRLATVPSDASQVQAIITLLAGMLSAVEATVTAAHTIMPVMSDAVNELTGARVRYTSGYQLQENAVDLPGEFFPAGPYPVSAMALKNAMTRAEAAQQAGISAELAYIGIPTYQNLVEQWQSFLNPPPPRIPPPGPTPPVGITV